MSTEETQARNELANAEEHGNKEGAISARKRLSALGVEVKAHAAHKRQAAAEPVVESVIVPVEHEPKSPARGDAESKIHGRQARPHAETA